MGHFSQVRHDLEAGNRVQSTRWLIQEQDLWTSDELTGNADSALLSTGESFSNRGADDGVGRSE